MARSDKLFARLDECEAEFCKTLHIHLRRLADGEKSRFLLRQEGFEGWESRTKCDDEADAAESLEKEILTLRKKLGLSESEGPLAVLDEYVKLRKAQWDPEPRKGPHITLHPIAQILLAKLKTIRNAD